MKRIALASLIIVCVYLIITSWQSTAQECIPGVDAEIDGNVAHCPSDYPIVCCRSFTIPACVCCPESHPICGKAPPGVPGCCPSPCPAEMAHKDNIESLTLLREFRDTMLRSSPIGQEIIKLYYNMSPVIVRAMEEDEEFKQDVKEMIDEILPMIGGTVE